MQTNSVKTREIMSRDDHLKPPGKITGYNGTDPNRRRKPGRPSKFEESGMIARMDAIAAPDTVWQLLFDNCKKGNQEAIKLWLAYRCGVPRAKLEVTDPNGGSIIINAIPVIDVSATEEEAIFDVKTNLLDEADS